MNVDMSMRKLLVFRSPLRWNEGVLCHHKISLLTLKKAVFRKKNVYNIDELAKRGGKEALKDRMVSEILLVARSVGEFQRRSFFRE